MNSLPGLATTDRVLGVVIVVALGILQAGAMAFAAFATRDAFAALHEGRGAPPETLFELLLAGIVTALCMFLSSRQSEALGQSYAIDLRRVLYERIAQLPKARHDERRLGALALRFVGDLSAARLWFGRGLPDVITATVVLPGAVAILCVLDPMLAGAALLQLSIAIALMGAAAWRLRLRHRLLRLRRSNISISMIERIAIAPELDLMGRTKKELRRLDEQGQTMKQEAIARRGRIAGSQSILVAGAALSGLAILWASGEVGAAPATTAACLSVLALVTQPLQSLGAAWDRFCAWSIAREKALRLLREPVVNRSATAARELVSVEIVGEIDGRAIAQKVSGGEVTTLHHHDAARLAREIAGLDAQNRLHLLFAGSPRRPCIAYIGDDHIGVQGSLRRSATLSARKRPTDAAVEDVLCNFGLKPLLMRQGGLDQRIRADGKGLTPGQTLRLELARAVIGRADAIVICSLRWLVDPERHLLVEKLRRHSGGTVILASAPGYENVAQG